MTSRFVSAAEEEFSDAAIFYEGSQPGLGEEFVLHVLATVSRLERFPESAAEVSPEIRSMPLPRFPFSLIYRVHDREVVVLAVTHQSRRPGYWGDRLREIS